MATMTLLMLHSGFVSPVLPALEKKTIQDRNFMAEVTAQPMYSFDTSNSYDPDVEDFIKKQSVDRSMFQTFEFREMILKKAIQNFSVNGSFRDWVSLQRYSTVLTDHHVRWLKETVAWVMASRKRSVSNTIARRLLTVNTTLHDTAKDRFIELDAMLDKMENRSTVDAIARWSRSVEGMIDLLASMDVVFGPRQLTEGQHATA